MKEFRVKVKLYNNLLVQLREDEGLTQRAFAEKAGIPYIQYNAYECLRSSPIRYIDGKNPTRGLRWKSSAELVAAYYRVTPEYLWPDSILAVEKSQGSFTATHEEMLALTGMFTQQALLDPEEIYAQKELESALQSSLERNLDNRELSIITRHFGLDGEDALPICEVTERLSLGIKHAQVNYLEKMAFHKLRNAPGPIRDLHEEEFDERYEYLQKQYRKRDRENERKSRRVS